MPWCVARNYFTAEQIENLNFPAGGWYAAAAGPEDKTPPAMMPNDKLRDDDEQAAPSLRT